MNYYKSLTKDEMKSIKNDFLKSKDSKVYKKSNKIVILSIIGIVFSFVAGTFDYLYKTGTINYVMDGLLFVFSLFFLCKLAKIKNDEINKFALKNKKNK